MKRISLILAGSLCLSSALWCQRPFTMAGGPFQPDADGYGQVTLNWSMPAASRTEIHVGAPDGALFASGGSEGTAQTGRWVNDGARFYLQDVSAGASGITAPPSPFMRAPLRPTRSTTSPPARI
jgi:hypothetical protein